LPDIGGIGAFDQRELERIMPKRAAVSSSALQAADSGQFASIALFSGIGLLISLVIVVCRMNGIF
jgi:hypothetical protein